ncbi:MAG TPA: PepSY-associated TM helix domain-containing protein, partial [Bryobacteraceae bacterium]|nr:PepSY-associated TM helix domain-containing protein [Bryobacteraceae bacterium]
KRFNWELHTVIGFWTLPLMLMFGLVGVYAGFPAPFQTLVNKIAPLDFYRPVPDAALRTRATFVAVSTPAPRRRFQPRYSTGDEIIRWFSYLHFGNFGGWWSKTIWVIVGLAPAFLFVTGFLMWWNRVVWPQMRGRYNTRSWQRNVHSSPLPD